MADRRCINAYQEMRQARAALAAALRGASVLARVEAIGVVLCADLPVPASDAPRRM